MISFLIFHAESKFFFYKILQLPLFDGILAK